MKSYLDIKADKVYKDELAASKAYKKKKNIKPKPKKKVKVKLKIKSEEPYSFDKASGVYFKSCKKTKISYAEQRIIDCLKKNNILFYREVIFKGFFSPAGGQFRFDFYFPRISTIIEYDGEKYHKDQKSQKRDEIKTAFCLDKEITLYRLNKTHWKNLEEEVLKCLNLWDTAQLSTSQ